MDVLHSLQECGEIQTGEYLQGGSEGRRVPQEVCQEPGDGQMLLLLDAGWQTHQGAENHIFRGTKYELIMSIYTIFHRFFM